jgi:RimJ/RimL family protein N-acetyltransferase
VASIPVRDIALRDGAVVRLQAAEPEHAQRLIDLGRDLAAAGSFGTVAGVEDLDPDVGAQSRRILKSLANPAELHLVAMYGEELAGEADISGGRHARLRHVAKVSISLAERWRGRGLGEIMMRALLDWAQEHPVIARVTLAVFEPNVPARRLYEKLGFQVEGVRVGEIRLAPDRYVDDLILARWVKPPPGA